ncbi:MAG: hypothetical protein ABR955_09960 [Verrucomicrobiota bacterium]|jgi:ribulose kinase
MSAQYTISLDYRENSVRTLVDDTTNGSEVGTTVWDYEHGTAGVVLLCDPNIARRHSADYVNGASGRFWLAF